MDNMDEGVLKLTNHKDHPTNKAYKIFFFHTKKQADYFKQILETKNIFFEFAEDENKRGPVYLFGIRKTDNAIVQEINYMTIGKFREPFIPQKWAQYLVIILGIGIVVFSIISYFKNN